MSDVTGQFDVTDQFKRYSEVIARAWKDEEFKKQLLDSPLAVLRDRGLHIPKGTKRIEVHQDKADIKHFVLLSKPSGQTEDVWEGFICC